MADWNGLGWLVCGVFVMGYHQFSHCFATPLPKKYVEGETYFCLNSKFWGIQIFKNTSDHIRIDTLVCLSNLVHPISVYMRF